MAKEGKLRQEIIKALNDNGWHAIAVDNETAHKGTPDINWRSQAALGKPSYEGWIECKKLDAWPRRPATPVRFPKFTREQRQWLLKRASRGGIVHVAVLVRFERFLFPGAWAAEHLGHCNRTELVYSADAAWGGPEAAFRVLPSALIPILR